VKKTVVTLGIAALLAAGCGTVSSSGTNAAGSVQLTPQEVVGMMSSAQVQGFCQNLAILRNGGLPDQYAESAFAQGYTPNAATDMPSAQSVFNVLITRC
jgi:uncharacterized protein YceK